ncbi:hypothetical protein Hanom_Chr04g00381651 [Helianthus anomalus]
MSRIRFPVKFSIFERKGIHANVTNLQGSRMHRKNFCSGMHAENDKNNPKIIHADEEMRNWSHTYSLVIFNPKDLPDHCNLLWKIAHE